MSFNDIPTLLLIKLSVDLSILFTQWIYIVYFDINSRPSSALAYCKKHKKPPVSGVLHVTLNLFHTLKGPMHWMTVKYLLRCPIKRQHGSLGVERHAFH